MTRNLTVAELAALARAGVTPDYLVGLPVAVEAESGAQLLPRPRDPDPRQKLTEWNAIQCCSADQRAKQPIYRDIAARIIITYPEGDLS